MFEGIADKIFEVELAGQTYKVIFDMNAMHRLENRSIDIDPDNLALNVFGQTLTMLWAAMATHHEDLSERDVGAIFLPWQMSHITGLLNQAVLAAFTDPSKKKAEGTAPIAESAPTGS